MPRAEHAHRIRCIPAHGRYESIPAFGDLLADRLSRPRRRADSGDLDRVFPANGHPGAVEDHPRRTRLRQADARAHRDPRTARGWDLPDIQKVIAQMRPLDGAREFLDWLRGYLPGGDPVGHLLRVRGAADAPTRLPHALLPRSPGGRGRPRARLPAAHARPEARVGEGVQVAAFPHHRRGRFLQRHHHARRGPRGHPVPAAGERDRRVSAVSGRAEL